MPASSLLPKVLFTLAAVLGLLLGLTTYTFPLVGKLADADAIAVVQQALGVSTRPLPGAPPGLDIQQQVRPAEPLDGSFARPSLGAAPQPAAWARRAAAADSGALAAWLDHAGVFTGTSDGFRRTATLWRLTLHRGCPLVSRFRTVTTIATDQLVELSSDCPRVAVPDDTPLAP